MDISIENDIVPFVLDARPIRALADHPQNRLVTPGDWKSGYTTVDPVTKRNVRLSGLTPLLDAVYWSREPHTRKRGAPVQTPAAAVRHRNPVLDGARGAVRGTVVHRQVVEYLTLNTTYLDKRNPMGVHDWCERVFALMLEKKVLPALGNVPVFDLPRRLCTELDLVGVSEPSGHLVLVEIKTGYRGAAWTTSRGAMRNGLRGVLDDTPLNRAIVQLVVSAVLLAQGHGVPGDLELWVLHVDEEGARRHVVTPAFLQLYGPLLVEELADAARVLQQQRVKRGQGSKKQ